MKLLGGGVAGKNVSVSIVMTYFERLHQLRATLRSFELNEYSNIEVVIVDDGSEMEPLDAGVLRRYSFPVLVRRMSPAKSYANPCVPFNVGIRAASGNIIILQNSECAHVGNVVEHAREWLTDENYLTYACYSLGRMKTERLRFRGEAWRIEDLEKLVTEDRIAAFDGDDAWYNHSRFRPSALHFCSAISRRNMDRLGGFDERFARGIAFDDLELLARIKRLRLQVKIIDDIVVLHQWHYSSEPQKDAVILRRRNEILYRLVTRHEKRTMPAALSLRYGFARLTMPLLISLYGFGARLYAREPVRRMWRRLSAPRARAPE